MARIFISYRRDDSRETALQLLAALKPHFIVFMDVEGILVGKDFRATVERELLAAQVVLIVIGTQWVTITGKDGSRRLDKLDDLVRIEAEMALRHDAILVPAYGIRRADGLSFDVVVEDPIPPGTPEAMTQALNDSLGRLVDRHPGQWLWIHRRWK